MSWRQRRVLVATAVVLLAELARLRPHPGAALSIAGPPKGGVAAGGQQPSRAPQAVSTAAAGGSAAPTSAAPPPTTLPPLVTTISLNNYIDSLAQPPSSSSSSSSQSLPSSPPVGKEPTPGNQQHSGGGEPRSAPAAPGEEHDEHLATAINNHSRNQAQAGRPPQYVDVSALVGRNMSSSAAATPTSGSAGLQGKSRSGLPECATQQVCNAIFVRMNYTQRLCECSANYNWKCSHQLDPQDGHTIELTRKFDKRIYTQIKTCEPLREVRACKSPQDWTLLALQSERSGKAHYVVVCKCPTWAQLEGPYTHNHPPYANIPGIRVYGMLCSHQTARSSSAQNLTSPVSPPPTAYATYNPALGIYPDFPWQEALQVLNTTNLLPAGGGGH